MDEEDIIADREALSQLQMVAGYQPSTFRHNILLLLLHFHTFPASLPPITAPVTAIFVRLKIASLNFISSV